MDYSLPSETQTRVLLAVHLTPPPLSLLSVSHQLTGLLTLLKSVRLFMPSCLEVLRSLPPALEGFLASVPARLHAPQTVVLNWPRTVHTCPGLLFTPLPGLTVFFNMQSFMASVLYKAENSPAPLSRPAPSSFPYSHICHPTQFLNSSIPLTVSNIQAYIYTVSFPFSDLFLHILLA